MEDKCNCPMVSTLLGTTLLGNWNGDSSFPVLCHCWIFQICWHTECKTLMESSFRNLNSSGISLDPLALLTVMLLKAHWLHTAECLGLWVINHTIIVIQFIISFLYSSSMYFFHLFLIHLSFTRSLPFVSFTLPIWVECSLEVSNYSWRVNCT